MQEVTIDRHLYIGGSDIPIILGISPFKKRFDLLLEKAGLQENEFKGNEYTEYGNVLEPLIRSYINGYYGLNFLEGKLYNDDIRCHFDGICEEYILEVKTTSQIKENVDDYQVYLSQLITYMYEAKKKKGLLAVYERPKDFSTEFDEKRLRVFEIHIDDYKDLLDRILEAIDQFRIDLKKIKENPFLTEEDLQPKEVIELSNQCAVFEMKLQEYKELENQYKQMKEALYQAMEKYNIKSWETNNGTKVTRVFASEDKVVQEFNESKFKKENEELYNSYLVEKTKKGRKGYVTITLPKGE